MTQAPRWLRWADNDEKEIAPEITNGVMPDRIDWVRVWPFIGLHAGCLAVIWTGISATAVAVAVVLYLARMFAITAFYHRYFAHKAFSTGRVTQFVFAVIGTASTQRGPLWWAGHHRGHHRTSDTEADPHSPLHGFWQSHCGWFLGQRHFHVDPRAMQDFKRYPELVWLDRFDVLVPLALIVILFIAGELLAAWAPGLGTNGWQLVVWGYFISTVVLLHATLSINSLAHRWGQRRYLTRDHSRNNFWLALITLGEGWHNNHHHYAGSARQGFFWWEIDLSYYGLWCMSKLGLVWNLKPVPARRRDAYRHYSPLTQGVREP